DGEGVPGALPRRPSLRRRRGPGALPAPGRGGQPRPRPPRRRHQQGQMSVSRKGARGAKEALPFAPLAPLRETCSPTTEGRAMTLTDLRHHYRAVRRQTERLCAPLAVDDYQVQAAPEVSPPKWHLAHTTWFFETFVLRPFLPAYRPFHPRFEYLFNSYYERVGTFHPKAGRAVLSRPTVEEVYRYRAHVDAAVGELTDSPAGGRDDLAARVTLGLHHEQQHQELLLMDVKLNFAANPLRPAYH